MMRALAFPLDKMHFLGGLVAAVQTTTGSEPANESSSPYELFLQSIQLCSEIMLLR
jgi:hypothetical protein